MISIKYIASPSISLRNYSLNLIEFNRIRCYTVYTYRCTFAHFGGNAREV